MSAELLARLNKVIAQAPSVAGVEVGDDDTLLYIKAALLELVLSRPHDSRSVYWVGVCPPTHFETDFMVCWDEAERAARIASASMSWKRCRSTRSKWEEERMVLIQAGLDVTEEQYRWASLVVQTRAVRPVIGSTSSGADAAAHAEGGEVEEKGAAILCPIVDLANHESTGPMATIRLEMTSPKQGDGEASGIGGSGSGELVITLVSNFGLAAGAEITVCYNSDFDYLDLFETYVSTP